MFRKTMILLLAAVLAALSVSAASASEPGIFGEMAKSEYGDPRLAALEAAAEPVAVSFTAEDGTTVEICQAYYERNRVFVSYRLGANTDLIELHEGFPDEGIVWLQVLEDWVAGEMSSLGYADLQKENDWLDGNSRHWLEGPYDNIQDSLMLEDGTFTDIRANEVLKQPDGSLTGWMECVIPEEKAKDTMTFSLVLTCIYALKYQDLTTFREYWENRGTAAVPFTLTRHKPEAFTGSFQADAYRAEAVFYAGKADLTGKVMLTGVSPEWMRALNDWQNNHTIPEMIESWDLYPDGKGADVSGMSWITGATGPDSIVFEILYPQPVQMTELTLCPCYSNIGERTEEAFTLTPVGRP